ncbi:protein-L-isoaspartate(D-aspartate) O-methyltransferase [Acidovorax sp. 106]|jgi:protein-L-isoaspartate(D-aspartate) O-methyltransferase|uniref:protein-L-isoaspartate(D-aspartate) O-methyltransferase n=1 Tax=Acidovorax sp. 106 TaxID=2135637 RepID=UPI000EB17043|nr:protein-L-isoaspartate(D-aspartate) O-methyltransferase [Acidovorax sp. 106]RLJ36718.1 protein-L-isoaspartate(D-aspartate) O-methyltransferase [Acidovorax sp. 106]
MQRRPGFPAKLPGASNAPAAKPPAPALPVVGRVAVPTAVGTGLDSAAVRARMVQKLAAAGVSSPQVLQAMGAVERHRFVDSALGNQAYEDTSLPIGMGQTISKPSIVARMCELLLGAEGARAGGMGRVLEIGTGCGYQAAVLSLLAREVYTLERVRNLHEKARDNLRPFRLPNVHLLFGDGMLGYAKGAPYAAIIAAAGGDSVPQAWCDQLAVGGRLVAPMAVAGGQQMLLVIDKTVHGLKQNVLEPVHFVPLKSGIA